ncbi:type II toxin-antitoxin system PemK/MazF family toxin [Lamprobacter sp.]|uniref:type II toxin-antitoxin system PemK/MazF family toxin n=1 Tax=Lamprobacter sp. TaxID=3100796 RepID=UPI003A4DFB5E
MEGVNRGDVVLAATAGDYGKPRPWLVVQTDVYNHSACPGSIIACPFTTHEESAAYRIPMDLPSGDTQRRSWVMVDKLMAIRRERLGAKITTASRQQIAAVEHAMAELLGLRAPD